MHNRRNSHVEYLRSNFHDCIAPTSLHPCASKGPSVVAAGVAHMHRHDKVMIQARAEVRTTDTIKWVASVAQIFGYGATAMGATPLNLWFFVIGIAGWFVVGLHWNDRAITLIHIVALGAMIVGLLAG